MGRKESNQTNKLSSSKSTFLNNSFRNTNRVSISFDPYQARHFVGPDLGRNWLQRSSADDTGRQRVNEWPTFCLWVLLILYSLNAGRFCKIFLVCWFFSKSTFRVSNSLVWFGSELMAKVISRQGWLGDILYLSFTDSLLLEYWVILYVFSRLLIFSKSTVRVSNSLVCFGSKLIAKVIILVADMADNGQHFIFEFYRFFSLWTVGDFVRFLSSAEFFFQIRLFWKQHLLDLIWVPPFCKGYQQTTLHMVKLWKVIQGSS